MKNARKRLTEEIIKATRYPDAGQVLIRDSVDIGLVLRLTPGSKTFCFEGAARHRMHRVKLGAWPDMSLAIARRKARSFRTEISEGRDPFTAREQQRQADKDALTFEEMAAKYITDHAKPRLRSSWRMERRLKQHFSRWNNRRLEEITVGNASAAHSRIAEEHGRVEADRALELARAVFNKAIEWELLPPGRNPVRSVEFFNDEPSVRALHADEFERVIAEIAEETDWRW
ncbi:MAG TPA: Arm DNA-binding domain-containing protein, partial [Candidatus Binataceae bacterium]|nr:Arm DNA-binding domain-containing protein [Candidatus Binataceae bacterium]